MSACRGGLRIWLADRWWDRGCPLPFATFVVALPPVYRALRVGAVHDVIVPSLTSISTSVAGRSPVVR